MKGVTGFGSALVAVPVLAYVYSPAEAVFLSAGVDVLISAYLTFRERRNLRWRLIALLVLPAIAGQWMGTELLTLLPERTVRVFMAVVIAALGVDVILRPKRPGIADLDALPETLQVRVEAATAGVVAGISGGLVGTPGPPVAWFMRRWFSPRFFRAQMLAVFAVMAVPLLSIGAAKGLVDSSVLTRILALFGPALLGGLAGAGVAPHVPTVPFLRAVGGVLLTSAVMLLLL